MSIIIIEFLLFSFLGWLIDLVFCTILYKKITSGGFLHFPLCPIYGIGGLLLMFYFKYVKFEPDYLLVLVAGLLMILLEYVGGLFCEKILKVKVWDYTDSRFDVRGIIDPGHSLGWIVLTTIFYWLLFPRLLALENIINIPKIFDTPLFLFAILFFSWLTFRRIPGRFEEVKREIFHSHTKNKS